MTTALCERTVAESTRPNQSETCLNDREVWRRVASIRSKWSLSERTRRREEAEGRFIDLMCALGFEAA